MKTFAALCLLALCLLALGAAPALAQTPATARCQALADTTARLACYDTLFPPLTREAAPAKPASPPPDAAAQFGLPQKPKPAEVESIETLVVAGFEGWGPNDRIRLQNGQVWEVVDGSSGTITPAMRKVTVRRGALGSFFLDFEGLTKSPRVRRVQ